jgi:AcrR family transcriptional regulator
MSVAKAQRADSRLTRECILTASVELFSEKGFGGTSMRAIADAAGVNLAATNYHFGSKAQLFEAAFQRCVAPINIERIRRLNALEAAPDVPTVGQIVRAFVDVGIALDGDPTWPKLIARIFVEPKTLSIPLLERAFAPTAQRFFKALRIALPEIEPTTLEWRFHFLVGAMLQLIRMDAPLKLSGSDGSDGSEAISVERKIDELVGFVVAGLCQDGPSCEQESQPKFQQEGHPG